MSDIWDIDQSLKIDEVLRYCEPHIQEMWAARISGILLGCDFKDVKTHLESYFDWAEEHGINSEDK